MLKYILYTGLLILIESLYGIFIYIHLSSELQLKVYLYMHGPEIHTMVHDE